VDEHPSSDHEGFDGGVGHCVPFACALFAWHTVVLHGEVYPLGGADVLGHIYVAQLLALGHADYQIGTPVVEYRKVVGVVSVSSHLCR